MCGKVHQVGIVTDLKDYSKANTADIIECPHYESIRSICFTSKVFKQISIRLGKIFVRFIEVFLKADHFYGDTQYKSDKL